MKCIELSSDEILILLRNRFCKPAWAFLPQVRNGTGYLRTTRTADALAMSLYPSRGLDLHGFEIKVNRTDWLNELKNPDKAEEIAQFVDFWWIVSTKDVVKVEELPLNWGLMTPFGSTVKIVKQAKLLKSIPIDRLLLAAILRKAQEIIVPEAQFKIHYNEGKKEGEKIARENFNYERKRHEELQKTIRDFEKTSGVHINSWHAEDIGSAVRMVLNEEHLLIKPSLKHLLESAEEIVKDIKEQLILLEIKEKKGT